MKKKTVRRNDMPYGDLKKISDFLPAPDSLLPAKDLIKVTVALDKKTLVTIKQFAEATGQKYQRMIREILKLYAEKYS